MDLLIDISQVLAVLVLLGGGVVLGFGLSMQEYFFRIYPTSTPKQKVEFDKFITRCMWAVLTVLVVTVILVML